MLLDRQDRQFSEVRKEIRDLAAISKENALGMKDLMIVLTESATESRHTRNDVVRLQDRLTLHERESREKNAEQDEAIDANTISINEKKANQRLILTVYSAILSGMFAFFGWMIGKG